jgi:hypothetical protein
LSLKPTDFGRMDMEETVTSLPDEDMLPIAEIPPRPDDMRTKEGREWKKLYGDKVSSSSEPVRLSGPSTEPKEGKPRTKKNVAHFKKILLNSHQKIAMVAGNPDIELDDEEATMLAESVAELLSYYNISVGGKRGAQLGVAWAVMCVYGPRVAPHAIPYIIEMIRGLFGKKQETTENNVVRANFSI